MRLIGTLPTEKQAYAFSLLAQKEGIICRYDLYKKEGATCYQIWVEEEDQWEAALALLERFRQEPQVLPQIPRSTLSLVRPSPRSRLSLVQMIILICTILFVWNHFEKEKILKQEGPFAYQVGFTPIQKTLIFDFPYAFEALNNLLKEYPMTSFKEVSKLPAAAQARFKEVEQIPSWQGIIAVEENKPSAPMFEKIRQGQIWRLFTPMLLHLDFLHLLFNMAWAWVLGKQMEARLSTSKLLFFILSVGLICNVAQYLMTGPYFVGFSGVLVGMVGFIWMRQRKAPWEGYPLPRGTILFFFWFVLAMCAFEAITWFLRMMSWIHLELHIANTAHILGGLMGIALGRLRFFARSIR